ncbi:hypothetical protein OS493_010661 [Desmophyllum pertusum]|uniref:Ion transport domain-containing protein n=1 Tax=Desmophyllum pertusum TaxID=174260 RepID=A0A9W9ZQW5_9CNID|nr:hypothetical protein OS493_010661 [Desmophyllum pertusum]
MLEDSEYIKLEGIDDTREMSLRLSLLNGRNSRRISDNSTVENPLRKSIDETVERNPCKRIGLHQACRDGLADVAERLIQINPSVCNELDKDGLTPLHHAARGNFVQIIQALLNAGADINTPGTKGCSFMTPLICASKFDSYDACRLLIQNGAEITKKTCNGQSPMHYAARKGHTRVLEVLLREGGAPVNHEDNDKATPLHTAAQAGQIEVIRKLVLYGGDMSLRDNDGYTPLHLAAREGHVNAFRDMLRKAKSGGLSIRTLLNSPDNYGNVCLHLAIKNGHREIVELCLESGADISTAQEDFSTPIHLACSQGNLEIAKLLVKHGAKIESEDGNGLTPLLRASLGGHVPIIEFLLEQGAQLYPTTGTCTPSPLMCAVKRSQHYAVRYFLARGFPLKFKDLNWRTVLHVAVACADIETVDLILENGGHNLLESKDQYGKTAMHYAASRCNVDIINRLILVGADVRAKDNEERIPLHLAAESGVIDVVRSLLSACPESVNDIDYGSRTPLHCAAAEGRAEVATHLLQNGAEVDYRDDERYTPIFHAAIHGCPRTVDTLLHYGGDINALDKNRKPPLVLAAYLGHLQTFRKFLQSGADATIVGTSGYNCLDAAIRAGRMDLCMEIIKHDKWREILSNKKSEGVSPMRRLIERFPQVAKLVLDKCIEHSPHLDTDPNYSITYDFSFVFPKVGEDVDFNQERYCGAKCMLNLGREELLFHPLTREMTRMKWQRIGLTVFFLGAVYIRFSWICDESWLYSQEILLILFCCVNLLLEAYQLYNERWTYFDLTNFLEVSTYVTTLVTILPPNGNIDDKQQGQFGIIALLLAFVAMLLQLQLLFCSGIYVTMLFEVLKSVFKVIVVFSMLILAYGLIFFLMLGDELSYTSPYMSVLKVFDMMAGGIEFNHYFVEKDLPMPELARFIVFTFILIMSISLMNLLIGLAVGDIESVQKNAELKRLKTQIESISQFEEKLPYCFRERIYVPRLVVWPNAASSMSFIRKLTWYLGW